MHSKTIPVMIIIAKANSFAKVKTSCTLVAHFTFTQLMNINTTGTEKQENVLVRNNKTK